LATRIFNDDSRIIVEYHAKIKILKTEGLSEADFEIPLYKGSGGSEIVQSVKASSFNLVNGRIEETKLNQKDVFTERVNKNYDAKKFAIPNVKVGSIIEVFYITESPYIFKFNGWQFQSHVPKLSSEYWATIPANYIYNMTLKGYLKLDKNDSELVERCFGGQRSSCARYKWAINNVPKFVEEDYMTAKKNFISSLNFELSEVKHFTGRIDEVTKEWKDAESELEHHEDFGIQLKKARSLYEDEIAVIVGDESDPLKRLNKIYDLIRNSYRWNEDFGMFTDVGVKNAFEVKAGNVSEINLTLVAALRTAKFEADPVMLSTRAHGLPIEIHPVISDFNYVVARAKAGDKFYMLDATDRFVPMGVLPVRCLNGKGRVLAEGGSFFVDLIPTEKQKTQSVYNLKLDESGSINGTIQTVYYGYAAVGKRREIFSLKDSSEYLMYYRNEYNTNITSVAFQNLDDVSVPLKEQLSISIPSESMDITNTLLNPFILRAWKKNPFVSSERSYPVDFAMPIEERVNFVLTYPATVKLMEIPPVVKNALPGNGGRIAFETINNGNTVMANFMLQLNKSIYEASEYPALKELFNIVAQVQNTDLYLKKTP
jgi:hypothetical protein